METILIASDEPSQLRTTEQAIKDKLGYITFTANSIDEAIRWMYTEKQPGCDLLLLDFVQVKQTDADLIRTVKASRPQVLVMALIPYGDEETAQRMVEAGVDDFLSKPVMLTRLRLSLRNLLQLQRMGRYIAKLERKVDGQVHFEDIIGESPALKTALAIARQAASSKMPVWIEGERGTGKEWLARAIHGSSARSGKPFVMIDCAAVSGEGMELTHKLREADQGTLFIKDVDLLDAGLQQRILSLRDFAKTALAADIRFICSTRMKMDPLVAQEKFSPTLYQWLRGVSVILPPLRERKSDIEALARHFILMHSASENKYIQGLTPHALELLVANSWPGNVRQLSNQLWRAVLICNGDTIDAGDIRLIQQLQPANYDGSNSISPPELLDMQGRMKKLKSIEEEAIRFALHYSGGCMTRAARNLGIGRSTLYRRVSELELSGQISRANHTTRPMMTVSSVERS